MSEIEQKQYQNHRFVNDIPNVALDFNKEVSTEVPSLSTDYFFKYHSVYISKHNRFAPYPKHSHKFLELNYMLSGNCQQVVDGERIMLNQGDILMMNIGCSHSIAPLGENDLLINLLFRDQSITFSLLNDIHSNNSLTYSFLSDISLGKKQLKISLSFRKIMTSKTQWIQLSRNIIFKNHFKFDYRIIS
jgi:AraC-like ligand binding domain.